MKTQGKLLIGLGWSEGAHFIKIDLRKRNRLLLERNRICQQVFMFEIKKKKMVSVGQGSSGNSSSGSQGNSNFA